MSVPMETILPSKVLVLDKVVSHVAVKGEQELHADRVSNAEYKTNT